MPISIQIESPRGTVVSAELSPGQKICIAGRVTTISNVPNSFEEVTVDVYDDFAPLRWATGGDWNGWYWIDNIVLPDVVTLATVRVGAHFALSGWEYAELPIGIGMRPSPPPGPGPGIMDYVKYAAIGSVAILGIYVALKLFRK
jgi:hypothetical protein